VEGTRDYNLRVLVRPTAILLVLLCACSCATHLRPYACAATAAEVDPHEAWACHRDIARRAAQGKEFTLREFREAAGFFEDLTGIPADVVPTDLGPIPGRGMRESLARWDAWYQANAASLAWDPHARRVFSAGTPRTN
jgi:hypothetical protein